MTKKKQRKELESEGEATFFVTTSENAAQAEAYEREEFFRALKKVVKKLPLDSPFSIRLTKALNIPPGSSRWL